MSEQVDYAISLTRGDGDLPAIGVTKMPFRKSPFLYTLTLVEGGATLTPRAYFRSDDDARAFVATPKEILNR